MIQMLYFHVTINIGLIIFKNVFKLKRKLEQLKNRNKIFINLFKLRRRLFSNLKDRDILKTNRRRLELDSSREVYISQK